MGLILWGSSYVHIILLMNYFQETILFSSSLFLNHSVFPLPLSVIPLSVIFGTQQVLDCHISRLFDRTDINS